MNQKTAVAILLVALILTVGFTTASTTSEVQPTLFEIQPPDTLDGIAFSAPIVVGAGLNGNSANPLDQPTRLEIYNYVKDNPGVHFRGICDGLDLSVGVVQYHLYVLENSGYITSIIDRQSKRFFQADTFTQLEMSLISIARHETAAEILTILSENKSMLHRDIATELGVSSQALTWQMNQLKKAGLINAEKQSVNVMYSLVNVDSVRFALEITSTKT